MALGRNGEQTQSCLLKFKPTRVAKASWSLGYASIDRFILTVRQGSVPLKHLIHLLR